MTDVGHMNFFNIDRCGLYRNGDEKTFGCEVTETFDLISSWVKGRPFSSTIPWDPDNSRSNKPKAYCKDIFKCEETGDFFLVLWKSDPGGMEGLLGVPEDDAGGGGEVVKHSGKHRGKRMIWGRPCYYWIIPEYNAVVSIKFDHSVCDAQLFQDYVSSCVSNRVKHPNREREYTDCGYVRIFYSGDGDVRYRYSFSVSLKFMETSSFELQELSKQVTHIVRRETVRVDSQDARAEWVKKFSGWVPYVTAKSKSKSRRVEVRAEASPSVAEIRDIIETSTHETRSKDKWDNVGFETDKGVVWVDRYRLKDTVIFSDREGDIITAEQLFNKIKGNRFRYLRKFIPRDKAAEAPKEERG
ncbi:hypothetical protein [Chromohalobacter sp.]|uniref:hypothetical protein n=2 Tax=Chromohalobacter sp. TaxID=50740 RepID=UPI0032420027